MKMKTIKILTTFLTLLAATSAVQAQSVTSGHSSLDEVEKKERPSEWLVMPLVSHTFASDIDGSGNGDVDVTRLGLRGRYTFGLGPGSLGLGTYYEYSDYNFSRISALDDNYNRLSFDGVYLGDLNLNWGYFAYSAFTFAASGSADLDDGFLYSGAGGMRYTWSTNLSLGLGLGVSTSLEDDTSILPVIALNWQATDRLHVRTLNGVFLNYDLTGYQTLFLDASVQYQKREYRLQDNAVGPGSGSNNQSMIESAVMGELGLTYQFTSSFSARAYLGVIGDREYDIRRRDRRFAREDTDPALTLGLNAIMRF